MPRNVIQDVVIGGNHDDGIERINASRLDAAGSARPGQSPKRRSPHKIEEDLGEKNERVLHEKETALDDYPFFKKKIVRTSHAQHGRTSSADNVEENDHFLERRFAERPPRKRNSLIFFVTGIAAIGGLGIGLLFLFKGVTVLVTPKTVTVILDSNEVAYKSPAPDKLGFDIMKFEGVDSAVVPAGAVERVDTKALGTITIKNTYSAAPQKLVANTRFQTPEGRIYRIIAPVTIPGRTKDAAAPIPGTIDVAVVADQPGDEYNRASTTTMTIPGFSGDPREAAITAETRGALAGGFSGMRAEPAQPDIDSAVTVLKKATSDKLIASALSQKPDGFQLYSDGAFVHFDDPQVLPNTAPHTAKISIHATFYGILFDKKKFAQFLAKQQIGALDPNDDLVIANIDALTFQIANKDMLDPVTAPEIGFHISGEPQFVWNYDRDALALALAGRPRGDFNAVMAEFPTIAKARAEFRPLGLPQAFPSDRQKISIVNN